MAILANAQMDILLHQLLHSNALNVMLTVILAVDQRLLVPLAQLHSTSISPLNTVLPVIQHVLNAMEPDQTTALVVHQMLFSTPLTILVVASQDSPPPMLLASHSLALLAHNNVLNAQELVLILALNVPLTLT